MSEKKIAHVMIREAPWYRREAFVRGLKVHGYEVLLRPPEPIAHNPQDLLVIWNRYGSYHDFATRFEKSGGTVLVAENGYISASGSAPKFDVHTKEGPRPNDYYALAIRGHNGSGIFPDLDDQSRFEALGLALAPWQENPDGHLLVCGQRGIGSPTMASPPDWHEKIAARISKQSKRRVQIRTHPGNDAPKRDLALDLAGAWACVIWSSGSGVKALAKGIPVFFDAPHWICERGALKIHSGIDWEQPMRSEGARRKAMVRMSWGQWTVAEIESGLPFEHLLPMVQQ